MRAKPQARFHAERCAYTASLRRRARAAEGALAEMRAERDAANALCDAVIARTDKERAALIAFVSSPEWERELLIMARDKVRAEFTQMIEERRSCSACGGFGRGVYDGLLSGAIDAISQAHGLEPAGERGAIDWPSRMGGVSKGGRLLAYNWLSPPTGGPPRKRKPAVW